MNMTHAAEFKRCLLQLDITGMRKLWAYVAPHLTQPLTDAATLHTMHLARTKSASVPVALKEYSEDWLAEHETQKVSSAVGISVRAPAHRQNQAVDLRGAMSDAVMGAYRAGVDLDKEAPEVRRRIHAARVKVYRGREVMT